MFVVWFGLLRRWWMIGWGVVITLSGYDSWTWRRETMEWEAPQRERKRFNIHQILKNRRNLYKGFSRERSHLYGRDCTIPRIMILKATLNKAIQFPQHLWKNRHTFLKQQKRRSRMKWREIEKENKDSRLRKGKKKKKSDLEQVKRRKGEKTKRVNAQLLELRTA